MTSVVQGGPLMAMGTYGDWLNAWKEWARTRKRGKMAQFIVEKLEESKQARWLNITQGKFELTEWHDIAKEWFKEKPRNSDQVDAPCMLRKGLPRAFPGLEEVKSESVKEGTQYRSRVFIATRELVQEVMMYIQNGRGGLGGVFQPPTSTHPYHHPYATHPIPPVSMPQGHVYSPPMVNGGDVTPPSMHSSMYPSPGHPQVKIEDGSGYIDSPVPSVASETQSPFMQMPGYIPTSQMGALDPSLDQLADVIVNHSPGGHSIYSDGPSPFSGAENSPYQQQQQQQQPQEMLQLPGVTDNPDGSWISPQHSQHNSPRFSPDPTEMAGGGGYPVDMGMQVNPQPPSTQMSAVTSPPHQMPPGNLSVKVVPDSSPLEGGGQMVLVFYNELPPGNKFVMFLSRQRNKHITVETTQGNSMVLYALIPCHDLPETVLLQVYCEGRVLAQSEFTYYANTQYNSDQLFHYLVQNMPQYFQMDDVTGAMGGGMGMGGGGGGGGPYGYYGNIPASTYGLLLGACRLGLEPLVYHTLQIKSMAKISGEQLQKAYSCSHEYGHQNLSECLKHLVRFSSFVSRDSSVDSPLNEGTQKVLAKLDTGGDDALATSHRLLSTLLEVSKQAKSIPSPTPSPHPPSPPVTTATIPSPSEQPRRLSSTKLQKQDSVKDPDDDLEGIEQEENKELSSHKEAKELVSGQTLLPRGSVDQEWKDSLPPLPRERLGTRGRAKRLIQAHSDDNDSAVSMSFDHSFEDHDLQREVERRMSGSIASSGLFSLNVSDTDRAVSIAIDPAASYTFAHSLQYESVFMVTDDYPSGEEKTIFRSGDRILAVGDTSVRGMGPDDFQELLEKETQSSTGTTVKILPRVERSPPPGLSLSLGSSLDASEKKLHRRQSEQQMLDSITMKVSNLLSMKASGKPRSVTIPSSPEGFGFKLIGGNAVGLFVSEVKPGRKEVSQGDQILEINGKDARHMTHYEATQLLRGCRDKVHLTVMDNGAKFTTIREQFEFDSFYMRSLVDHKDMQLRSNMVVRVVNTFLYSGNFWLAWIVDESGTDCELRKIPSPTKAKHIYGKDVYAEVDQPFPSHSPSLHPQALEA